MSNTPIIGERSNNNSSNAQETEKQEKPAVKKHISPSRAKRNRKRAEAYRIKKAREVKQAKDNAQNNNKGTDKKSRNFWNVFKSNKNKRKKMEKINFVPATEITKEFGNLQINIEQEKTNMPTASAGRAKEKDTPNPNIIYKNLEHNMKLSRLEEPTTLTLALRHITRQLHPNGGRITFPVPASVDKIQLRCNNLPTEGKELLNLVEQVFKRRQEDLDIEELYKDFVKTHGRITIDPKQQWPQSHIHTRHP